MGLIKYVGSMVMIALFSIAIITFAVNFGNDNDTSINLADDDDFTSIQTNLEENITVFYSDAETSSEAFDKSTISTQTEATEGGTSFKVGPWTALGMVRETINISFKKIFGADSGFQVFFTALISLFGFITVWLIYKAWAGRTP